MGILSMSRLKTWLGARRGPRSSADLPDPSRRILLVGGAAVLACGVAAVKFSTPAVAGHSFDRSQGGGGGGGGGHSRNRSENDYDGHSRYRSRRRHSRSRSERYRHSRYRSGPGWGRDDCAYVPLLGMICGF